MNTREQDRKQMEQVPTAGRDNPSSDANTRFVATKTPPGKKPAETADAFAAKQTPTETKPSTAGPAPPDPASVAAWNKAAAQTYDGDRDDPPVNSAPSDGRSEHVYAVDPKSHGDPYMRAREFPYPQAPPTGSAMAAYAKLTTKAQDGGIGIRGYANPQNDGRGTPTSRQDANVKLPLTKGVNPYVNHFSPTFKDKAGREAASEPIVDPDRPHMAQYVAPATSADQPEPKAKAVPADVKKKIEAAGAKWLASSLKDIEENPAKAPTAKWKEIESKSRENRKKVAKSFVKERLAKWPVKQLQKARDKREREKKQKILDDVKARSTSERQVKVRVTAVERAAKVLDQKKTDELTSKERAQKPKEKDQKALDKAARAKVVKEAKEKYKEYDVIEKAAQKKELEREKASLKERTVKQEALEKAASAKNETLAESMGQRQRSYLDILAKDAYTASLNARSGLSKKAERSVAVRLEERAQVLPDVKPAALAATGIGREEREVQDLSLEEFEYF